MAKVATAQPQAGNDQAGLQHENAALREQNAALRTELDSLKHQLDWFKRQLFGATSERRSLADEGAATAD